MVPFCKVNDTATRCDECMEGYTRVERKGGIHYCYKISDSDNCLSYDEEAIQSNTLKCNTCKENDYILSMRYS